MNAVASSNFVSGNFVSGNPGSSGIMPVDSSQVHTASLITRELTLQRNRNRILAASQRDLLEEIKRLKQENVDLERLACIDSLTGIFNRHMLMQEIARSMKLFQRYATPAVMLLIDLNRFKQINDEFGHAAGDKALSATASHLSASIRATDCVARLGGDEFVVILNNAVSADALHIADKLFRSAPIVDCDHTSGTTRLALRYAIGHATLSSDIDDAEAWLRAADLAMYRSKFFDRQKR